MRCGVAEMPRQNQIVLIRHGETEWSRSWRHTGRTDLPLTEPGQEQARAVGALLATRSFALVLTSPLLRARETAELAGYRAETEPDLREWDYGDCEGLTTAEIRERMPGRLIWQGPVPGGERLEQVAERADRVITRCREEDGDVALFAHGHILRILMARWCELPPIEGRRFLLGTGTLSVLGWEHDYRAILLFNASLG